MTWKILLKNRAATWPESRPTSLQGWARHYGASLDSTEGILAISRLFEVYTFLRLSLFDFLPELLVRNSLTGMDLPLSRLQDTLKLR